MAEGAAAGLELVEALASEPSLAGYHLLPTVRGDLLARLGRLPEARAEFERAAGLTRNARERDLLLARAAPASPLRRRRKGLRGLAAAVRSFASREWLRQATSSSRP